ncbi:DUF6496 domain-containing protein [Chryseolinea sp. T2]|uniref:DUF6496 domain-containing protein n=1 Tax=Chryseolinea sp. T2 TaxID=3129255 RepID=UPI00307761B2
MAKYGKKAQTKVKRAMHEMKEGTLRSGRSGKKVTSRKQAVAIGLSEARQAGGKVPKKSAKKTAKKSAKKSARKMGRPAAKRGATKRGTSRSTRKTARKSSRR